MKLLLAEASLNLIRLCPMCCVPAIEAVKHRSHVGLSLVVCPLPLLGAKKIRNLVIIFFRHGVLPNLKISASIRFIMHVCSFAHFKLYGAQNKCWLCLPPPLCLLYPLGLCACCGDISHRHEILPRARASAVEWNWKDFPAGMYLILNNATWKPCWAPLH